jgi:hypothetical protein
LSLYALQKAIRDVNRDPAKRAAFFEAPAAVAAQYALSEAERAALHARDYATLYAMGVHGLLLRPFSILHAVSEADYLRAIRGTG